MRTPTTDHIMVIYCPNAGSLLLIPALHDVTGCPTRGQLVANDQKRHTLTGLLRVP